MFPIVKKWNFIWFQISTYPKIACSFQFPHLFFALLGGAEKFPSPWPLQRKQGTKPNGKMNDGGPHFSPVPSRNNKSPRTLKRQAGQLTRAENSPWNLPVFQYWWVIVRGTSTSRIGSKHHIYNLLSWCEIPVGFNRINLTNQRDKNKTNETNGFSRGCMLLIFGRPTYIFRTCCVKVLSKKKQIHVFWMLNYFQGWSLQDGHLLMTKGIINFCQWPWVCVARLQFVNPIYGCFRK